MNESTRNQPEAAVHVERLPASEEKRLLDFFRNHLPAYPRFAKLWNWRKACLPASGGETAVIARYRGDIVGAVGIVPVSLTVSGRSIHACWQQDSLVSSAMRGMGVGKKLVTEAAEGYDVVMAKGTSNAMYGLRKSIGFQDVLHNDVMVRVLRPRYWSAVGRKTLIAEWMLYAWGAMVGTMRQGLADSPETVSPIYRFGDAFDMVAAHLADGPVIRPWKDSGYLNWRYCHCPGRHYRILQCRHAGQRGAMVTTRSGVNGEEGWIVDHVCSPDNAPGFSALLSRALNEFKASGVRRAYAFATHPETRRRLIRFGFVSTGRSPRFTYKIRSDSDLNYVLEGRPWDFWHGDGDLEMYP